MSKPKPSMKASDPGFAEWVDELCAGSDEDSNAEDLLSIHDSISEQSDENEDTQLPLLSPLKRESEDGPSQLPLLSPPPAQADDDVPCQLDDPWSPPRTEADPQSIAEFLGSESSSDEETLADLSKRLRLAKSKPAKSFIGKNRFKWSSKAPSAFSRTRAHNLIRHLPGVKGPANRGTYCSFENAWNVLFTDEMLTEIIKNTNMKLKELRQAFKSQETHFRDLDLVEMKAFIGLLFYTAIFKSNHEDLNSIYATDGSGRDIFPSVMSKRRMQAILSCLRFDDYTTRQERMGDDPIPHISWVMDQFLTNCRNCYTIGEQACIDEMLIGFRGRCRFRMYIPNKPNRYGLKLMALTDAKTNYLLNAYLYTGKDSDGLTLTDAERKFSKPTQSVIRLSKMLYGSNRNITADNWFSSMELVQELLKNGLTYVGTLRKNKREIPAEFATAKGRPIGSSLFGFTRDVTLVSFVPKPSKTVILLSSMHHDASIDPEVEKPEIITYYNATKGGVDTLDQMCASYSVSRNSRRWPLTMFYAILNISLVNAFVIWKGHPASNDITRLEFVKNLAKALVEPHMRVRQGLKSTPSSVKARITQIIGEPAASSSKEKDDDLPKNAQRRCTTCPRKKDRKTRYECCKCLTPQCLDCAVMLCENCRD